jgi:hypothetical protein
MSGARNIIAAHFYSLRTELVRVVVLAGGLFAAKLSDAERSQQRKPKLIQCPLAESFPNSTPRGENPHR